jgi:hypothetical protein
MSLLASVHDLKQSADFRSGEKKVRITCTNCQRALIHRSRPKGIREAAFPAVIFVRPFRSEECDSRFFRWSMTEKPGPERPARTS